jgi:hypothetical protein
MNTRGIVLEFARADHTGQPHAFRFAPQRYLLRAPGGGFESAEFPWSAELLDDLQALRGGAGRPEAIHRLGDTLRGFLEGAGWSSHERAIVDAVRAGERVVLTIRSAAAELYALPWELLALKSTGQLVGGVPGLLVRYEWPETASFPARPGAPGRVLLAWSAAGGAVPAAEHQGALRAAFAGDPDRFDPARDVIPRASFARIAEALDLAEKTGPPVVAVHLLCHGTETAGTYGLALDDEQGGVAVDAGRMQQLFAPHADMVRLVVLAACDSGDGGQPGNYLGSVAQMIHRCGVQALVASRFPLSLSGSVRFAAAFYPALVSGPLEPAFLAARDALVRDPGQLDWASVQLYARAADGDLTRPLATPPSPAPTEAPAPARRWLVAAVAAVVVTAVLAVLALSSAGSDAPMRAERPTAPAQAIAAPAPERVATPRTFVPAAPPDPASTGTDPEPTKTDPDATPTPRATTRPDRPPSVDPKRRCPDAPGELQRYLKGVLKDSPAAAAAVRLQVRIDARGALRVTSSDDAKLVQQARDRLDALDAGRIAALGGDALPCTQKLEWRP